MIDIRKIRESDWPALWSILQPVIATGDTYAYAPEASEAEIHQAWVATPSATFVACDAEGKVLGAYFIRPNMPGLGAHVANCGYVVSIEARGRGIAKALCEHSQVTAVEMGCRAMQFNFVVSTNAPAVHLWKKLGFAVVGTLPGAYHHRQLGYVDAYVMFKTLTT